MMNKKQQALKKLEQLDDQVLERLASLADNKKALSYFTNPLLFNALKGLLKL